MIMAVGVVFFLTFWQDICSSCIFSYLNIVYERKQVNLEIVGDLGDWTVNTLLPTLGPSCHLQQWFQERLAWAFVFDLN